MVGNRKGRAVYKMYSNVFSIHVFMLSMFCYWSVFGSSESPKDPVAGGRISRSQQEVRLVKDNLSRSWKNKKDLFIQEPLPRNWPIAPLQSHCLSALSLSPFPYLFISLLLSLRFIPFFPNVTRINARC